MVAISIMAFFKEPYLWSVQHDNHQALNRSIAQARSRCIA